MKKVVKNLWGGISKMQINWSEVFRITAMIVLAAGLIIAVIGIANT